MHCFKILQIFLLLLAVTFLAHPPALADIYRYVDANGVIHFTNTPTHGQWDFYRKEIGSGPPELQSYRDIIRHNSHQFRLEEALIKAVIKVESDYDPQVVSSKGAQGLMQLIPETAKDLRVADPFNPAQNIRGGSQYLRQMLDQFDGDLELALAAYNAGPNAVRRHGGVPPYDETRNYIQRVKRYLDHYRKSGDTLL